MGRKKLSLTDEERILRKKEQMKKVYEKQKLLKKRRVENLHPEQLEKKRSRDRIENLKPEQLEKLRARRRIANLKPEQLEKKRKHNITYYENIRNKKLKLMLDLYEARQQVEYLDNGDLKKECKFCGALTFEGEMSRSKNNCCHLAAKDLCSNKIKKEPSDILYENELISKPGNDDDGIINFINVKEEPNSLDFDNPISISIKDEPTDDLYDHEIKLESKNYSCNYLKEQSSLLDLKTLNTEIKIEDVNINNNCDDTIIKTYILNSNQKQINSCFSHSNSLKNENIYSGEKSYKYIICSQFLQLSTLRAHARVHTGDKPYKCDICCQSFSKQSNLTRHQCVHTDVQPFKCNLCFRMYSKLSTLKKHQLIHIDDKPFKCNICFKTFTFVQNLIKHEKIHDQ